MEPTGLLGRDTEQAEVEQLLRSGQLVTISGTGGIGKTALAKVASQTLAHARDGQRRLLYPDGVQLVELQALHDPGLVPNVIAAHCGLPHAGDEQALDVLVRRFHERPGRLLVLDNAEHLDVQGRFSETVEHLVNRVPQLRILCTSRRSLDIIDAEQHLLSLQPLAEGPAVRLIRQRVALHSPQLHLDDEVLRDIVARLDRIPLWLERAAARMRFATPVEVRERLIELFHDKTTPTTARRRSRSLQHTGSRVAQWTWDQCTPEQQLLWQRMAVLAGSAHIEAIRAVTADEDLPGETVPALVEGLADESVLEVNRDGPTSRYRLYESYRQFALGALRLSGTESSVRQRYTDWVYNVYAEVAREWLCPDELAWVQASWSETDHLRAVLEWCATSDRAETGIRLAFEAFRARLVFTTGDLQQWGRYFFQQLRAAHARRDELYALCLACEAYTAVCQGDQSAHQLYNEAAEIPISDPTIRLQLRQAEAALAVFSSGDPASVDLLEEIIAEVDQLDDAAVTAWERGTTVMLSGMAAGVNGEGEAADHAVDRYRHQAESTAAPYHGSWARWCSGVLQWRRGNIAAANSEMHQSLPLQRQLGDGWGPVWWVCVAAWLAAANEDYLRAAELCGATRRVMGLTGVALGAMANLGRFSSQVEHEVEQAAGAEAYRTAAARGEALPSFDACLALALGETDSQGDVDHDLQHRLTARELDVARLVAEGLSSRQIAEKLSISPGTVRTHVSHVCEKLGVGPDGIAPMINRMDS